MLSPRVTAPGIARRSPHLVLVLTFALVMVYFGLDCSLQSHTNWLRVRRVCGFGIGGDTIGIVDTFAAQPRQVPIYRRRSVVAALLAYHRLNDSVVW